MKVAALIPHFNHEAKVHQVVSAMRGQGLDVLIVDDGSDAKAHEVLKRLAAQDDGVRVHFCPQNGGKGHAMKVGFRWADELGYSHVLQVDADAQHHLADATRMLMMSRQHPDTLICGKPVYGDDAPKARLYGRKLTNFWATVNAEGTRIHDAMCGFRLYPLAPVLQVIEHYRTGDRMEFDIAILVYLSWQKVPIIWIPTTVRYDQHGVSHFMPFKDNARISLLHTRLCFEHIGRLIGSLLRRRERP
ncbi:MAG: glycosyltransferase family 2 protein [Lautropia sp.]|nr:glycosyltransferase family 2 protein [Lautropia sp.]